MSSPPNALPMTAGLMDMEIPRTVMMRKIKQAADGKPVQKDAKTALSKAAAVFISYLTAAARDDCLANRNTRSIAASNVFSALDSIGYGDLTEAVQLRIEEHKASVAEKAKKRAESAMGDDEDSEGVDDDEVDDADELDPSLAGGLDRNHHHAAESSMDDAGQSSRNLGRMLAMNDSDDSD